MTYNKLIGMNRLIFTIFIALFAVTSCKQTKLPIPKQEIKENVVYKLFPTENLWTFIKLDTRNGRMWQVQYSLGEGQRGEVILNDQTLFSGENGRFTLLPTKNLFNFILLDQLSGKTWQVQWSFEEENRCIMPITLLQ